MASRLARTPEELHSLFVDAFNAADLEGLLALYESDAAMVPKPHQLVRGRQNITHALQQLLSLKASFTLTSAYVIRNGGIALLRGTWRLQGTGPNGQPVHTQGCDVEVAREQADGSWKFVVDHAYGADHRT